MLNEIFSKYRNDDNKDEDENKEELNSDNESITNIKNKYSDFLNEKDNLTYKKKSADIMWR